MKKTKSNEVISSVDINNLIKAVIKTEEEHKDSVDMNVDEAVEVLEKMKGMDVYTASTIVTTGFLALPLECKIQVMHCLEDSLKKSLKLDILKRLGIVE